MRALMCIATGLMLLSGLDAQQTIAIRDKPQSLRLYGKPGGQPVIVSSGDGGWIHLAPQVAETLAARGFYVIGFDTRAYLESFTQRGGSLRANEVPADYRRLIDRASQGSARKPILIGVSEGAGLSVLAATDRTNQAQISGVIALGLSDQTELAWRWRDMAIYLTHGTPNEPTFSVGAISSQVAPVPLAAIHSTHDEYAPLAEVQAVMARAIEPKRLWVIDAADHRFSNQVAEFDRVLIDAIGWLGRPSGAP